MSGAVTPDSLGQSVYAGLAAWGILVSANATKNGKKRVNPVVVPRIGNRKIYAEFYSGLILPVVTGSALFALLLRPPAINRLEWWGAVFFVLYFSAQHARRVRPERGYGGWSFSWDSLAVLVFFVVTFRIGVFEVPPILRPGPQVVFGGVLALPFLAAGSRIASGGSPRYVLSGAAILCSTLGLVASIGGWAVFADWMMGLLMLTLIGYLICNFVEDGGEVGCSSGWCR
jgi:hypothetical protein